MPRSALLHPILVVLLDPQLALAYGESHDDRPSIEERALHFYTDQLRMEPGFTDPEFESVGPLDPLVYNPDLNDAARFYADDMDENGCFPEDHSSCDGTPFGERLAMFYAGGMIGENIARGQMTAYSAVFEAWLYSTGHRENMFQGSWEELGTGFAGTYPVDSYWVQDFGARGGVTIPPVTSGTHAPLYPQAGQPIDFLVAVHSPDSPPSAVEVLFDGVLYPLEAERGFEGSQSWGGSGSSDASGCLDYVFLVTLAGGEQVRYPDSGALLLPSGDATCASWSDEESEADPAGPGDGGFIGTGNGCGAASGDPEANVGEDVEYGSCRLAPGPRNSGLWLLTLAALLTLRRQRG